MKRRFVWVLVVLMLIGLSSLASISLAEEKVLRGRDASASARTKVSELLAKGRRLTDEEADKLEVELKANPDDLSTRTQFLGYYFGKRYRSASAREKCQHHIVWIIQNHPSAIVAGLPEAKLNPILDKDAYYEAKQLWLKQVEDYRENTAVLGNAASFFLIPDKRISEDLLERAQTLEPDNLKWPDSLGRLWMLNVGGAKSPHERKEAAKKALEHLERAASFTVDEQARFPGLKDLAKTAFEAGDIEKAREYATELLNMAAHYEDNWNYGNAVHHGNLVLGRIALRLSDLEKAKEYLIEAGKTTGSPQLNSFGPNMTLAKELLEKGEREVVIEYFQLCAKFWRMERGRLKEWTSIVKGGGIPDFRANLRY